jgi:anaerobic selenocysteine-containing dehydrogenase
LRDHVRGLSPAWAAEICGIPAARIVEFARRYATTERAMLLLGGASMYKDCHGWQSSRAISCLAPLTGKLGKPGCGFGPRHAGLPHGHGCSDILNFAARPPGNYVPTQMSAIIDAFNDGRVRAMLMFGSDFVSSFADGARVKSGFEKMELVVSHELFMNDTARRYADIVLPGTTWLEELGSRAPQRMSISWTVSSSPPAARVQ